MCVLKILGNVLVFIFVINCRVESKVTDLEYNRMPKTFQLDNFDNCMDFGEKALYCTTTLQLAPDVPKNESDTWKTIQKIVSQTRFYRHDILRHGICIPISCPEINVSATDTAGLKSGIAECYSAKYKNQGLKAIVTKLHCEANEDYHPVDNYDIAIGISLGLLISMVFLSSVYEGRARYKSKEEYLKIVSTTAGRIFSCFSIPKNWERLRQDTSNPDTDALKCLNGLRFYTVLLVILVHSALCTLAVSIDNTKFVENLTTRPENFILVNGLCAIQTFMVMTGFLLSYNVQLIIAKGKRFRWVTILLMFINRYIRLTPCLLVMLALNSSWVYHVGRGPMWEKSVGAEYKNCRNNWWTNLLYINNYYDPEHMCMQHAWYLATDTQLFTVSLIVIALMWKYQKRTKLILGIFTIIGLCTPSIVNFYNNYDIVVRMYPEAIYEIFLDIPHWHAMYSSSIVNIIGYAVGMTFGYVYYKRRSTKFFTNKLYVGIWWILVYGFTFGVVFSGIPFYYETYEHSRIFAAIYVMLYRSIYVLGVSLLIYGCAEGIGWIMRDCFTWKPVQVMGRISYCVYLVHVVVMRVRAGYSRSPGYITYYTMISQASGDAVLSVLFGTLLVLFVELPVSALQNLMLPQLKLRNQQSAEQDIENKAVVNGKESDQRF